MTSAEDTSVPPPGSRHPLIPPDGPGSTLHRDPGPDLAWRELVGAMLLAGALGWGVLGVMYYSFVLWALLEAIGIPATVVLSVAVSLKVQQSSVSWVTGSRLPLTRLALAAAPSAVVSVAVHQLTHGPMLTRWLAASAVGLVVNSAVLARLLSVLSRREQH